MRLRRLLLAAGIALLGLAAPANAANVRVIAHNLDNPRQLAFADHHLFVAEAGSGGAGPCVPGPEQGTVCVGNSGAVTLVDRRGQRRIVNGLASIADQGTGNNALGPHGVFVKDHKLLITNGGPDGANRDELAKANPVADLFGRVLSIKNRRIKRLADIWGFERDNNPDAQVGNPAVDSNAVDVLVDHGRLVVADAGGNDVLKARRSGEIKVLSLFPNRDVPDPMGGTQPIHMQAVPTGVVKGPDGGYFMTQLTGFPFPVGGANVYRINPATGAAHVFASGFTNLMDLAFGAHGKLWVLEIDHDSLLTPNPEGAIYSIDAHGRRKRLALPSGTLTHPGGIAVGAHGVLYVTNKADMAGAGEVLRIKLHGNRGHRGQGKRRHP
jgi:hypothetical protein